MIRYLLDAPTLQALEALRKLRTEKAQEVKELKLKLEHTKTLKDQASVGAGLFCGPPPWRAGGYLPLTHGTAHPFHPNAAVAALWQQKQGRALPQSLFPWQQCCANSPSLALPAAEAAFGGEAGAGAAAGAARTH